MSFNTYPNNAQLCHSSYRRGGDGASSNGIGGAIVCPEDQGWCVKEVMSEVPQEKCGNYGYTSDYFGDTFDGVAMSCVLRKCNKTCVEQQYTFGPEPDTVWTRQTFCCNKKPGFKGNPCNSATRNGMGGGMFLLALIVAIIILR